MIRIGDFSKISVVSVKTLRYYDELGLLKPVQVDPFTGYRMYEFHQLERLNRILALKDLGFSLEEIGQLLGEDITLEQMRGMLKLRRAEARQKVQEEAERLDRVEARLRQIEQEDSMSNYEVVIKRVEAQKVAALRALVATPPEQGAMWMELGAYIASQHARCVEPCFTLYYDEEYKERDWDVEVCQPFEGTLKETDRIKVRSVAAVETMACTIHHGPFTTIREAYAALTKWADANGYRVVGPPREVYLQSAMEIADAGNVKVSQVDPETITEVQFPVEKVR
jgi:DNA-binding transcriptional MerR regulator